jgi:hypothetical protein
MIVGILGKKHAGKSLVADYLHTYYGFKERTFAHRLKHVCKTIFNLTDAQLYGDEKEVVDPAWGTTPRRILQIVGTELFKNTLPTLLPSCTDVWIKNLISDVKCQPKGTDIVVSDCRFLGEVEALRTIGAVIIKLERDDDPDETHESEQHDGIPFDHLVSNNGTIDDLFVCIDAIMRECKYTTRCCCTDKASKCVLCEPYVFI